jgi:hypothetical protein
MHHKLALQAYVGGIVDPLLPGNVGRPLPSTREGARDPFRSPRFLEMQDPFNQLYKLFFLAMFHAQGRKG